MNSSASCMSPQPSLDSLPRITSTTLDLQLLHRYHNYPDCGAAVSFLGIVRNHHHGEAVEALDYTAYQALAEPLIRQIEREVKNKYAVREVLVLHRIGYLKVGEVAILGIAHAAHRHEAFLACEEAIERVKHEVPIYKEQYFVDGRREFVTGCCIRPQPVHADKPHDASTSLDHSH